MLIHDPVKWEYRLDGVVIPSVTQVISETVGVGWKAAQWYLDRGRAVHACCAMIGRGVEFDHDPAITGQVAACRRWYADNTPEVIEVETAMASSTYRYAGTPDLVCKLRGVRVIVDFKASLDPSIELQLGGYSGLVPTVYGLGVELREDGTYRQTKKIRMQPARNSFFACLTVWGLKRKYNRRDEANG